MFFFRSTFCLLATGLLTQAAAAADSVELLHGRGLQSALTQPLSVAAENVPLRAHLQTVQSATGIPIVLDRRIDPDLLISGGTGPVSAASLLNDTARSADASTSLTDHFVFLGPPPAATSLKTLLALRQQDVRELRNVLSAAAYRQLLAAQPAAWPRLSQPRQLLLQAAATAGLSVGNPGLISHDLWASAELPEMPFADLASLILIQFDLTFRFQEAVVWLEPIPQDLGLEQRHRIPARQRDTIRQLWQSEFPDLTFDWQGSTAVVRATVEQHERLQQLTSGEPKSAADPSAAAAMQPLTQRLLSMDASAGVTYAAVIASFRNAGVEIQIQPEASAAVTELLQQRVSFRLTQVPGAEFFPEVFADLPVKVMVGDDAVTLQFPQ